MAVMRPIFLPILFTVAMIACSNGTENAPDVADTRGPSGAEIYATNCKLCHGATGDLGMGEANDLTVSVLSSEEIIAMVTNGKGNMVPYKNILTTKQIEAVAAYVETLRKKE
ncbi:MAG: cytochrome c [Flavobacteriales bacterium]|nr:cytochrome c [Flavobacteriales bacterium]